jgi:formate dehydrogenase subunit gamma
MNTAAQAPIDDLIERHRERPGALLPLLHDVQARLGCIPDEVVPQIARALNLSRAEVHGVITFYHHFRRAPTGRHVIRLCQAEACLSMGATALREHAQRRLGCAMHESTSDGAFTLEPVYCLGQCAASPALMVDDEEVHARVSAERFDSLVATLRGQAK